MLKRLKEGWCDMKRAMMGVILGLLAWPGHTETLQEVTVMPAKSRFVLLDWWREQQQAQAQLPTPGDASEQWLGMQREGNMASANPQAATRELREKAAERFLKTYDQPIPDSTFGGGFSSEP